MLNTRPPLPRHFKSILYFWADTHRPQSSVCGTTPRELRSINLETRRLLFSPAKRIDFNDIGPERPVVVVVVVVVVFVVLFVFQTFGS